MSEEKNYNYLLQTMDAQEWAKAFLECWGGKVIGEGEVDQELMFGWFANALMKGFDYANSQNRKEVVFAHSQDGDWVAMYVNGEAKDQGDSLHEVHMVKSLNIPCSQIEVPQALAEDFGYFPDKLEDLEKAIEEFEPEDEE